MTGQEGGILGEKQDRNRGGRCYILPPNGDPRLRTTASVHREQFGFQPLGLALPRANSSSMASALPIPFLLLGAAL